MFCNSDPYCSDQQCGKPCAPKKKPVDPLEALEVQDIFAQVEASNAQAPRGVSFATSTPVEEEPVSIDNLIKIFNKYDHDDIRIALSVACPELEVMDREEGMEGNSPAKDTFDVKKMYSMGGGLSVAGTELMAKELQMPPLPEEMSPEEKSPEDNFDIKQEEAKTSGLQLKPDQEPKQTSVEEEEAVPKFGRQCSILAALDGTIAADPQQTEDQKAEEVVFGRKGSVITQMITGTGANRDTMKGSVLGQSKAVQLLVHTIALGGVLFVLIAAHSGLGGTIGESHGSADGSSADGSSARLLTEGLEGISSFIRSVTGGWGAPQEVFLDDHARRLAGTVSPMMKNITFSIVGAGLLALLVQIIGQPLILGYLLGGYLVGPYGLVIVPDHTEVAGLANLGLVFLLFMIGLELNLSELAKMGKVVIMTGGLQFPICAMVHSGIFTILSAAGLSFGNGQYATLYVGLTCGISSTMIVVKILGEKLELDGKPGRLTVGILIFQDIWAIILLAIQPNMANPEIVGILKTFGMCGVLILFAYLYAKFVMPVVFLKASKSVELMLVMALAWCFFIGAFAILPFIGLSLELAALIAGAVLATFPYSAEFNGKIKYLRDFFVTLFFVAMGMQIPTPTAEPILKAVIICVVVLSVRWLGIFSMVCLAGGGSELGCLATCNLSQVSEFALVIVMLGVQFEHVESDTLTIMIWAFSFMAIGTSYYVTGKHKIYAFLMKVTSKCRKKSAAGGHEEHEHEHHEHRDVVLLGFHRIASMLIAVFEQKDPAVLKKINVVETNQSIKSKLREKGVMFSYGDISSADVLEHAHHGDARLVLSTIPDSLLKGMNNKLIVTEAKKIWPDATVMAVAENHHQLKDLYKAGADYVLHTPRLCAERIEELLGSYMQSAFNDGELKQLLERQSQIIKAQND